MLVAGLLGGCQGGSDGGSAGAEASSSSPSELPGGCSQDRHCEFAAGTYRLSGGEVIPGMQLTLPAGWSSRENNRGELNLLPPDSDDDQVFFWIDMVPVTSTGPGHGTALTDVGTNPDALVTWLTGNPDVEIVTPPEPGTVGDTPVTTLTATASATADYGDPDCPANPRCVDLFTNPRTWGTNSYGIGGDEEAMISLGTVALGDGTHTVVVALDSPDHERLTRLSSAAQPIIDSVRFPA
ncbi:hypothetical protein [Geodermatophilus sp. URMC 63]